MQPNSAFPRLLSRLARDRRGTAAVEFAVLAPLFMLFVLGMVAYGILLGAGHSVQQLAADAARIAVAGMSTAERRGMVEAFVAQRAASYMFIRPERLAVSVGAPPGDPSRLVVSLRYDAAHLPIWGLLPELPLPVSTIARSSTVRVGGL